MSAHTSERPAPRTSIRLLWWFGIYFGAHLLEVPLMVFDYNPISALFFPTGLGIAVSFAWLIPNDSHFAFPSAAAPFVMSAWCTVGYAIYIWHLRMVIRAKTRRRFICLLLILVVLLLIDDRFWMILLSSP
jgi:hypothetical protein